MVLVAGLLCALVPAQSTAARLKVQIDADRAAINEFFEVTVQVHGSHVRLQLPETDKFEIEDATNQFNQPMFCMNMGLTVMSGPCVFSFLFRPKDSGKLSIPGFTLVDDFWNPGRVLSRSEEVAVTVAKEPAKGAKARKKRTKKRRSSIRKRGRNRNTQTETATALGESEAALTLGELKNLERFAGYDLFVVPTIKQEAVYLNQPFRVDFVLYVGDKSGASSLQGLELPDLEGFRKEEIEVKDQEKTDLVLKGRSYSAYLLSRYILVPMEPGERVLAPAKAVILATVARRQQYSGGGFSVSFSSGSQPVEVFSPPIALDVRRVPEPTPDGFDDANIGHFELASLEPPPPQPMGSWMVLKYRLKGSGNLLSVVPPSLPEVPNVEYRRPYLDNSAVQVDEAGVHGYIDVQLPFRMERAGDFRVPPLELVYFDPDTGKFGRSKLSVPVLTATNPEDDGSGDSALADEELAGIIADSELAPPAKEDPALVWVAGYALGVPAAYFLALLVALALRLGKRDTRRRRRRQALAAARRDLLAAGKAAQGSGADRFYALVARAVGTYVEGRFEISVGSSVLESVERELMAKGVPAELARKVRQELESSEFGRFAPTTVQGSDMKSTHQRVRELLAQLDRVRVKESA